MSAHDFNSEVGMKSSCDHLFDIDLSSVARLDGAEVSAWAVGLRIRRSPVPVQPKTNVSIMFTLPVKSTGE